MSKIIKHTLYTPKKGDKVFVEGRFVPENQSDKVKNNIIPHNFPQITLSGIIKDKFNSNQLSIDNDLYFVYFNEINETLEILKDDILFKKNVRSTNIENYIRIYKEQFNIFIDLRNDNVIFEPYDYLDDNPFVKITFNNSYFSDHINSGCVDCNEFYNDFGTNKKWFIEFHNKIYGLDLQKFDNNFTSSSLVQENSNYRNGTEFKLKLIKNFFKKSLHFM